jgi:ankyrin repeat protein
LGYTSLARAAQYGDEATVRLLVERGAQLQSCSLYGGTPPLLLASANSHDNGLQFLLDNGCGIHVCGRYGDTALSLAAEAGFESTVRLLLNRGANCNLRNDEGITSLGAVHRELSTEITPDSRQRYLDIEKLLKEHGAIL